MAEHPIALLALLLASVALADWLGTRRGFRHAGAAVMAILFGGTLANLGLLPMGGHGNPTYDMVFALVTPMAIFLVLLEVRLVALREAGGRMLALFAIGALGTALGVLVAVAIVPLGIGDRLAPIAGMLAATYIGGSSNFNAVALAHGMTTEGALYTVTLVVDNVMTIGWIVVTLLMPLALRRVLPASAGWRSTPPGADQGRPAPAALPGTLGIALPLALAVGAVALSNQLSAWSAAAGFALPSILLVTTFALLIAQWPLTARMSLSKPLGVWGLYLFLAVVGASADLGELLRSGTLGVLLFAFIAVIFLVHALLLIAVGVASRSDPDMIAIASTANIGGATTALALAESVDRKDLVLPGILIGTLGNALGTYVGLAFAAWL
jgi:uncharacterized membrane protein